MQYFVHAPSIVRSLWQYYYRAFSVNATSVVRQPQWSSLTNATSVLSQPQWSSLTNATSVLSQRQWSSLTNATSVLSQPQWSSLTNATSVVSQPQWSSLTNATSVLSQPQWSLLIIVKTTMICIVGNVYIYNIYIIYYEVRNSVYERTTRKRTYMKRSS